MRYASLCLLAIVALTASAQFGPVMIISEDLELPMVPVAEDMDGDEDLDIVTISPYDSLLVWFMNDGTGTFSPPIVIDDDLVLVDHFRTGAAVIDVDTDGLPDILYPIGSEVLCWQNLGGGQFAAPVPIIAGALTSIIGMDIDGDPYPDILGIEALSAAFIAYISTGGGSFVADTLPYSWNPGPIPMAHDLDTDGDMDVLFTESDKDLHWHENLGNGSFAPEVVLAIAPGEPTAILVGVGIGDVDGDMDQDLITSTWHPIYKTALLPNDGLGGFVPSDTLSNWPEIAMQLHDVDDDLDKDLLSVKGDVVSLRINDGSGTFGPVDTLHAYVPGGLGVEFCASSLVDLNGDLAVDLLITFQNYHPPPDPPVAIAWFPGIPLGVGSDDVFDHIVAVSPNPFLDQARITFYEPLGSDARIELLDVQGRLLRSMSGDGTREVIIERDGLGAGLYVVRVIRDGAHFGAVRLLAE